MLVSVLSNIMLKLDRRILITKIAQGPAPVQLHFAFWLYNPLFKQELDEIRCLLPPASNRGEAA